MFRGFLIATALIGSFALTACNSPKTEQQKAEEQKENAQQKAASMINLVTALQNDGIYSSAQPGQEENAAQVSIAKMKSMDDAKLDETIKKLDEVSAIWGDVKNMV